MRLRSSSSVGAIPAAASISSGVGIRLTLAPVRRPAQPFRQALAGLADALAHLAERVARLLEGRPEALGVELDRVRRLVARARLRTAPDVLAADDPVVLAGLDPLHDL